MNKTSNTLLAVAKIGELVTKTLDTSEILRQVVSISADIMKVDVCSIYLFEDSGETLVLEATVGLRQNAVGQVRLNPGEGITGRAAKHGRTVAVHDVTLDKRNKYIPLTGEELYRSLLSVPLKFQDELIGVINVQTKNPRTFTTRERRLLKTIAHQVSGLIRNARLYESVSAAKTELEHTQEKLIQSEKMAALGRLAATLSHELRNPLAGLKGATQLLLKKVKEDKEQSQYIDLILGEVERLGRIVEDLLHFARPREMRIEPADLNRITEEALLLVSQDLEMRSIKLRKRLSKLPPAMADKDKFKQVVVNILLNAIEAMPEGGELIVSSGIIRNEPEGNDYATFQFRDTGEGMNSEIRNHLFEPFYTTKPTGVGLGLSICKAIINKHGGQILVSSDSYHGSKGTVVTIEIPVNDKKILTS